MGLFDKRPPCAICGGKVKGLLPWKIEGNYTVSYTHLTLPTKLEV